MQFVCLLTSFLPASKCESHVLSSCWTESASTICGDDGVKVLSSAVTQQTPEFLPLLLCHPDFQVFCLMACFCQ